MAAYITLTGAGQALHLLGLRNLLSVANARLLERIGWVKPDHVRVTTPDGTAYLFELATLSPEGGRQLAELRKRIGHDDWSWGHSRNVLDHTAKLSSAPDGPQMVYDRELLRKLTPDWVAQRYAGSASGWSDTDLSDIEEVFLLRADKRSSGS